MLSNVSSALLALPFLALARAQTNGLLPAFPASTMDIQDQAGYSACLSDSAHLSLGQGNCVGISSDGKGTVRKVQDNSYLSYNTEGAGLVFTSEPLQQGLVWKHTRIDPDTGAHSGLCLGPASAASGEECTYGPRFRRGDLLTGIVVDGREGFGEVPDALALDLSVYIG